MSAIDDTFQNLIDAVTGSEPKQAAVMVLQGIGDLVEGSASSPQEVEVAAKIKSYSEALGEAIANTGPTPALEPAPAPQPEPQPEPQPAA